MGVEDKTTRPIIVAGCGRSGTHWLGGIIEQVLGPGVGAWEPGDYRDVSDVVVDSRLRHRIKDFDEAGHPIVHLVRDGRDVVRSLYTWYSRSRGPGEKPITEADGLFKKCCGEWADAIDKMYGYRRVRLEDLNATDRDTASHHAIPHHTEWSNAQREMFWHICAHAMKLHGYK
jgi:hypothetical protein